MLRRAAAIASALIVLLSGPASGDGAGFGAEGNKDGSSTVTVRARDSTTVGGGASGPGASGPRGCVRQDGQRVPCSAEYGWWSAAFDCYLSLLMTAPADDPEHAGEGAFRCDPGPLGWGAGPTEIVMWLPMSIAGPDPALLAQEAVDSMRLQGITIGTAPPQGTQGLVNIPVWLWASEPAPNSWGPISATAAAGGVSVTATARATAVQWLMGDGASVSCGKGVPYEPGASATSAPCQHTYRSAGTWPVTAATTWQVEWTASTGRTGSDTLQTESTTNLVIREARAQITDRG